jgi:uncharacterized protein YqgV (UPF0045/DUF77 family)
MRITVELSLYPLEADFVPRIEAAIRQLRAAPGIEMQVNQMSTQLRGELVDVMRAIEGMLAVSFADGTPQSLAAKFLNADLPIGEVPDV